MKVLDFARSTMTFRLDLDRIPPRTLSHRPPYALNNARAQLDCVCRVRERATDRLVTLVLGAPCRTEQVGADADLWLQPNAEFIPIFSDDAFLGLKTFAHAGMSVPLHPPGTGNQPDRMLTPIEGTFDRVHLDLVEREGVRLDSARAIVDALLDNGLLVGIHRYATARYEVEIEYPVKVANANERDVVYQTDTGPILFPDLDAAPDDLLGRVDLAFSAANAADWAEFIVRVRTPVGTDIEVHHYARTVRLDGIVNEFYLIPADAPGHQRVVTLPAVRQGPPNVQPSGGIS